MSLNKSMFGVYHPLHKLVLLSIDITTFALAFYFASQNRLGVTPEYLSTEFIGITLIVLMCLFVGGAYTSQRIQSRPKLPLNTFFLVLASTPPSLIFIYALGPEHFTSLLGRGVYPFALLVFGVLAVLNRHSLNYLFRAQSSKQQILLLCKSGISERLKSMLEEHQQNISLTNTHSIDQADIPTNKLNALIIGPDFQPSTQDQKKLLDFRLAGMPIYSLSDFFESFMFLVPVQEINNDWFIRSQGFAMLHSSIATRLKRLSDIVGALILGVVSLPIMLVSAIIIKTNSKGPVLFSQTRVGMNSQPFILYKFRTMVIDAESKGAQWASENDARIIPMGNFFRRTRIDELPQIWNILKGQMSIVGPRPERPEFTQELSKEIPYYDLRHVIKPGLTGWAQVSYPYGASVEDSLKKLQYDLYYVKNYSLLLDLNILLRTIIVTLKRSGR